MNDESNIRSVILQVKREAWKFVCIYFLNPVSKQVENHGNLLFWAKREENFFLSCEFVRICIWNKKSCKLEISSWVSFKCN